MLAGQHIGQLTAVSRFGRGPQRLPQTKRKVDFFLHRQSARIECGGVDVDGILVFVDNGRPEEYDDDVTAVFLAFYSKTVFFFVVPLFSRV